MAISDTQKVDYLFKKLGYGLTKTDVTSRKQAFNESIPSPLLLRGDKIWKNSDQIPGVIPAVSNDIVRIYSDAANTSATVECQEDITATDNRTWKTNLTDWITTEFGSTYLVKVYVDVTGSQTPQTTGTQLLAAGSTNNDEWFFDYQSGVLHFIGDNLPASIATGVTGRSVYVSGARYVGEFGVTGNIRFNGTTISTNANLTLAPANGYIFVSNSIISNVANPVSGQDAVNLNYLNNQISNVVGQITGTANVIYAADTKVEVVDDGVLPGKINFVVDGVLKANLTANSADFYVNSVNIANLTFNGDTITSTGNITLNPQNSGIVKVSGNLAMRLPVGDDESRPDNPEIGYTRFNSERRAIEYYDGSEWHIPGEYVVTSDVITPDGISNVYVLSSSASSDGVLVSINGTLQQPYVAYTVVGTNITFSETPLITDNIEVRHIAAGGTSIDISRLSSSENSSLIALQGPDIAVTGNLIPSANAAYSIGTASVRWQHIYCGGNISTTGNVVAAKFYGDGSNLTGLAATYGNTQVAGYLPTYAGNIGGTITTSAQTGITSVGTLSSLSVTGNVTAGNVSATRLTGTLTTASQTSITAVGNIVAGTWSATPIQNAYLSNSSITINGTSASLGGTATVTANAQTLTGTTLNSTVVNSSLTTVGNLTALSASGNISTTGNVVAAKFYGDGSNLTGLPASYGNTQVAAYLPTYAGNILAANVTAQTVTANISTGNITSINSGAIRIQTLGAGDIELNPLGSGTIQLKGPVQYDPSFNFTTTNGDPIPITVGVVLPSITASGVNGTLTLSGTGTGSISLNDDVTVTGNLTVNGTTTSLNVNNLNVQDNIINIASTQTGIPTQNAGLLVIRGDAPNVQMRWNESVDRWQITNDGTTYANIINTSSSDTTAFTGNVNTGGVLKTTGGIYNANPPIISTDTTITSAYLGGFLELSGTSPYTVTLPAPSLYTGAKITIWQNTTANITLATPSGLFYGPSGSVSNTKVLSQSVTPYWDLWSDSYNWILFGIRTV